MAHDNQLFGGFPASFQNQNTAQPTAPFETIFKSYKEALPEIKKAIQDKNETQALLLLNQLKEKIDGQIAANRLYQQLSSPDQNFINNQLDESKISFYKIAQKDFSLVVEAANQGLEKVVETLLIEYGMCTNDSIIETLYASAQQGYLNSVKLLVETFFSQLENNRILFYIPHKINEHFRIVPYNFSNISGCILQNAYALAIQYQKNDVILFLNHMINIKSVTKRIENNDPSLIYLNLAHCNINDQQAEELFKALQKNTVLNIIDLSHNVFTDKSLPHIIEMLEKNEHLFDIKFYDFHVYSIEWSIQVSFKADRFLRFIEGLIESTKTFSYFQQKKDVIENIIINILEQQFRNITIQSLNFVSYHLIIDEHYALFLFNKSIDAKLFKVASKLLALGINDETIINNHKHMNNFNYLSKIIPTQNIEGIRFLVENRFGLENNSDGPQPLQVAVNCNNIEIVDFFLNRGLFSSAFTLNVDNTSEKIAALIHQKTPISYLIQMLKNNHSDFMHLYLTGYIKNIKDESPDDLPYILSNIFDALAQNHTLTYLDLSSCEINDEHIVLLVEMLQKNPNVTYLNLSHNHITCTGLYELSKILGKNSSITHLDLCNNNDIKQDSICYLSMVLNTNTQLKTLKVSSEHITTETPECFADTLKYNTTLLQIKIGNTLSNEVQEDFGDEYRTCVIEESYSMLLQEKIFYNKYYHRTQQALLTLKNKLLNGKKLSCDEFDSIHFTLLNMQRVCDLMEKGKYCHTHELQEQIDCVTAIFYQESCQIIALIKLYLERFFPDYNSPNPSTSQNQVRLILAQTLNSDIEKFTDKNNIRKLIILLVYKNQESEAQNIFNHFYFSYKYPEKRGYNYPSEIISSTLGKITDSDIQKLFNLPDDYSLEDELRLLLSQCFKEICIYNMEHPHTSVDEKVTEEDKMTIDVEDSSPNNSSNSSSPMPTSSFPTTGHKRKREEDTKTIAATTQNAGNNSDDSIKPPPQKKPKVCVFNKSPSFYFKLNKAPEIRQTTDNNPDQMNNAVSKINVSIHH